MAGHGIDTELVKPVRWGVDASSGRARRFAFNDFNRAQLEVVPRIVLGDLVAVRVVAHRPGRRFQLQGLRAPITEPVQPSRAAHLLNALDKGDLHEAGWRKLPGLFAFQRTGERNPLRQKPHR